jgi:HAMP domain-containing protein
MITEKKVRLAAGLEANPMLKATPNIQIYANQTLTGTEAVSAPIRRFANYLRRASGHAR